MNDTGAGGFVDSEDAISTRSSWAGCVGLLISLAVLAVAGCGRIPDPAADSAPPGPGRPIPAVQLDAAESKIGQLHDWAQHRADEFGIPLRALQAYGYATVVLQKARPDCHLGWTTLAGIARIESDHARFGGAVIASDGAVRPPIRGVALNGTGGNAVIVDPAGSARVRRTVYARAMGPFQFIPDTWKRWGLRADSGYKAIQGALASAGPAPTGMIGSPDNIDDAALAAARYLCAAGGDLATASGWRRAVLAYNHSVVYLGQVRNAATGYET